MSYTLPTRHVFHHWDLAWVGFDIALLVALAATAYLGYRHSRWLAISATVLSTLLLVDVWFDVLSARPGRELALALAMAAVVEVPLAIISMWAALRALNDFPSAEGEV